MAARTSVALSALSFAVLILFLLETPLAAQSGSSAFDGTAPATLEEALALAGKPLPNNDPGAGWPQERALGDLLESFPQPWLSNGVGLAFDFFEPDAMLYFHEPSNSSSPSAAGIWRVSLDAPRSATAFSYTKRGGQDVDGGSVRLYDGVLFVTDFNGDNSTIGDNIYALDRQGDPIAFWETDNGLSGFPCSGAIIDQVADVAVDPLHPDFVWLTNFEQNRIFRLDLSNTSGGSSSSSPCSAASGITPTSLISDVAGIEYDPCRRGYWLSDFDSGTIVLVSADGSFNDVLTSFTGSAGGFNSGISPRPGTGSPAPVWATDLGSQVTSVWDSGGPGCSFSLIFAGGFESGNFSGWVVGP